MSDIAGARRSFIAKMLSRSQQRLCGCCPGNLRSSPFAIIIITNHCTRRQDPLHHRRGLLPHLRVMVSSISRSYPTPAPRAAPPHYQSFLTPILHRRFVQSCLFGFCVCYIEAFLISSKSNCSSSMLNLHSPLGWANASGGFFSFLVTVSAGLGGGQDFDPFLLHNFAGSYPPCISASCRHTRQSIRVPHLEKERRVDWDIFYSSHLRVCIAGLHPTLLVVWGQE